MTQEIKIIPSKINSVGPLKIFTYPTRLAAAWKADISEINIPAYEVYRPELEITIEQGSTKSLGIEPKNLLKRIYKKMAAPIEMGEEYILDARYETDKNIAHILKNIAPGLLAAKEMPPKIPKITVILRANASEMARNAYDLLGFPILCTDRDVKGKIIRAPSGKDGAYEKWYEELFGKLAFAGYTKETPARVFISRKGARSLINESEVEATLQDYGLKKFYYEDIPISEQWSITKNAKVIVGIHGAAMASIVFNCNRPQVIELFHPGYVTHAWRHMTSAVGGSWCGVTGQITENVIKELDFKHKARSFASAPTKIDIKSLKMALEYLEIDKQ
ncbi:MAG: glycosyltransferase family 61 protein [Gomphosphaeria aponina SAG 52.96 = DSM 107014]|uniref:Glycosyltransferase family 61 protein n=1 Tax=Gomphosphaeria aponina SAG 52.96 = DSM 107014 TaxID=1521640 RepID=A0A941GY38_9CHRO|nr:glycosyltransferase family 61 protein [Gomphosphaeria aponina SAG 52.96 = DSM 107014]